MKTKKEIQQAMKTLSSSSKTEGNRIITVGIDPGTNVVGVSIFVNDMLLGAVSFKADSKKDRVTRSAFLLDKIATHLDKVMDLLKAKKIDGNIAIEEPMLRGRSNNAMQRFLGYLEGYLTNKFATVTIQYYSPKTVKKVVAGTGSAEKEDVVKALLKEFKDDNKTVRLLKDLSLHKDFDATDAIAIALTSLKDGGLYEIFKTRRG